MADTAPFACTAWVLMPDGLQRRGRFVFYARNAALAFRGATGAVEDVIDFVESVAELRDLGSRRQFADPELQGWDDVILDPEAWLEDWRFPALTAALAVAWAGFLMARSQRRYALFGIRLDSGDPMLFAVAHRNRENVIAADRMRRRRRRFRRWWRPFRRS